MKIFTAAAAVLYFASYSTAGPCPFHQLLASGTLSERDAEIAHELASNPEYIPALDKRLSTEKREAVAEPQGGLGGLLGGILGNPLGGGLCM